jgi:hypothetical protein
MLTVFLPPRPPRREAASSERTFGSRCALHRKTRSHQDKPNPEASLARSSRDPPHRPLARLMLLGCDGVYASAQEYPLFTMSSLPLFDLARQLPPPVARDGTDCSFAWMIGGARRDRTDDLKLAKLALSQLSYGPEGTAHCKSGDPGFQHPGPSQRMMWWAWEDLNFRPHAYQARALTN